MTIHYRLPTTLFNHDEPWTNWTINHDSYGYPLKSEVRKRRRQDFIASPHHPRHQRRLPRHVHHSTAWHRSRVGGFEGFKRWIPMGV